MDLDGLLYIQLGSNITGRKCQSEKLAFRYVVDQQEMQQYWNDVAEVILGSYCTVEWQRKLEYDIEEEKYL